MIIAVLTRRALVSPTNLLLTALAVADLLTMVFYAPSLLIYVPYLITMVFYVLYLLIYVLYLLTMVFYIPYLLIDVPYLLTMFFYALSLLIYVPYLLTMVFYIPYAAYFYCYARPDERGRHPAGWIRYLVFNNCLNITAHTIAMWLTVSLAVFRYIAVCHPTVGSHVCTLRRARITIAAVVASTIVFCSPNYTMYAVVAADHGGHWFDTNTFITEDLKSLYFWIFGVVLKVRWLGSLRWLGRWTRDLTVVGSVPGRWQQILLAWVFGGQTTSVFHRATQVNSASYPQRDGK